MPSVAPWAVALGIVTLLTVLNGAEQALHFGGSPMDGPFQLFNVLRRIGAGQRPGIDFQVFHGVGLAYLHYLPYRIFGGGFLAGELTRQILTALLYPLSLVLFLRVFTGDWRKTLLLSTAVMCVSLALRLTTVVVAINSLLGARSFFALLVPVTWFAARRRGHWRMVLTGVSAAVALLTGTEQGIAVLIAVVLVVAITGARRHRWGGSSIDLGVFLATCGAATIGFLTLVGGWHGARSVLAYNFGALPHDQYWYFGAPPSEYAATWGQFAAHLVQVPMIPLVILLAIGFFVLHLRRADATGADPNDPAAALAMVALYGAISCASILGIFLVGYAGPGARVVLLLTAVELSSTLDWSPARSRFSRPGMIGAAAIGLMVVSVPSFVISGLIGVLPHVIKDHLIQRKPAEFIRMWPPSLSITDSVLSATPVEPGHARLWSTYAGLAESRAGVFNPSFDYIIHALGPQDRAAYFRTFRQTRPTLVQTVLPTFSPYEAWLSQTSGEFYLELLQNYRVAAATPWSIYWRRLDVPSSGTLPIASVDAAGKDSVAIRLPGQPGPGAVILLDLGIDYDTRNALGFLPLIGPLPRFFVDLGGTIATPPVTLDPYVRSVHLPVIALQGRDLVLRFRSESLLPGASLSVRRIQVSAVPITSSNIPWVDNSIAAAKRWSQKQ